MYHQKTLPEDRMHESSQKYGHILSCEDTLDSYEERHINYREMQALPLTLEGTNGLNLSKEEREVFCNDRLTHDAIDGVRAKPMNLARYEPYADASFKNTNTAGSASQERVRGSGFSQYRL